MPIKKVKQQILLQVKATPTMKMHYIYVYILYTAKETIKYPVISLVMQVGTLKPYLQCSGWRQNSANWFKPLWVGFLAIGKSLIGTSAVGLDIEEGRFHDNVKYIDSKGGYFGRVNLKTGEKDGYQLGSLKLRNLLIIFCRWASSIQSRISWTILQLSREAVGFEGRRFV